MKRDTKRRRTDTPREERKVEQKELVWNPKTALGHKVKNGEITSISEIFETKTPILESEIVDTLLPGMEHDLLLIGQSKGKFGGGARRVFRSTQKKTSEGNKPKFSTYCVIGNRDGIVGMGYGKAKETVPAREKALRRAKLSIFTIARGSGSWESTTNEPHTIPFAVEGRCGSVRIKLLPAPKGKGLVCEKEVAKILRFAGIKDIWSVSFGQRRNKVNLIKATEDALRQLAKVRASEKVKAVTKYQEGPCTQQS
jgi:small subunit ribosomal protein S5